MGGYVKYPPINFFMIDINKLKIKQKVLILTNYGPPEVWASAVIRDIFKGTNSINVEILDGKYKNHRFNTSLKLTKLIDENKKCRNLTSK
jgi:hypothetical protein